MTTEAPELFTEYRRVDADWQKPDSFPWFANCMACDLRRDMAPNLRNLRFQQTWWRDVVQHFFYEHKVEVHQHPTSHQLGELVFVLGPHVRTDYGVRFRIVAEDSPIKGCVQFDMSRGGLHEAEARAKLFAEQPEFADVAVVRRTVTITDWEEA